MQFYYGDHNILRALDEAEFWKHQEAEHTDLIPIVAPGLERHYMQELAKFREEMNSLNAQAVQLVESATRAGGNVEPELKARMLELVMHCVEQSQKFVEFMEEILRDSAAARGNAVATEVIRHMVRESQYFVGIAQLILV